MRTSDRILAGRRSRIPGDPWTGAVPTAGDPGLISMDPDVRAREEAHEQAEATRLHEAILLADARGYEAGHARAESELAAAIATAGALAHSLETAVPRDVDMVARTVAELAILIARRIVGAELRHDPSVLIAAIEAGLKQAVGASSVQVELHPGAVVAVETAWLARHGQRHRGLAWSFVADPTLPVGGCRLRTEYGLVEAGFEDQLTEVAAALDVAIPGYITSALGATQAERTGAPTADLAILASTPADTVRTAAARPAPELPLTPADEPIVLDDDLALDVVVRTYELPDFGTLA